MGWKLSQRAKDLENEATKNKTKNENAEAMARLSFDRASRAILKDDQARNKNKS